MEHLCAALTHLSVEQIQILELLSLFALAESTTELDPRSDSGRESVSSQWWEGVEKKVFVKSLFCSA